MNATASPNAESGQSEESLENLRLYIYDAFTQTGAAPRPSELAELMGDPERAAAAVRALSAGRHLALDSQGEIVLAHPFAGRSFGFSVMGERTLWWGGCAWDSFAIPHLVRDHTVLVATRCGGCRSPIALEVERAQPPHSAVVAHFATPMAAVWDDVIHACANQILYCSASCLAEWLSRPFAPAGASLDVSTLWRLASGWYEGRFDRGYQRRDPASAESYFASCGLTGPFWAEG